MAGLSGEAPIAVSRPRSQNGIGMYATFRDRELATVGRALQEQTGKTYRPVQDGGHTSGIHRRSLQLASDRFAMLDDGMSFSLVP